MKKTVRLLNKISHGMVKSYRAGFANYLIRSGKAEEIVQEEITQEEVKPKAKKKK